LTVNDKYTDEELVALLSAREEKTFEHLYEQYSASLYSTILQITDDEEQAGIVLQETFIYAWFKISEYNNSQGKLFTWMLNIARRLSIEKVRATRPANELEKGIKSNVEKTNRAQVESLNNTGLKKALQQLTTFHRSLIELAYFKGNSPEQIAATQAVSLATVKAEIKTALIQLRKHLK